MHLRTTRTSAGPDFSPQPQEPQQPGDGKRTSDKYLGTYLNDHLAGSVAALELLQHLERAHGNTPLGATLARLRDEILWDRQGLEALMGQLGIAVSTPRKAWAWMAEKVAEIKLVLDDPVGGALHLLEALEALSLGIEGKRSLWGALAAAAEVSPRLRGPDYTQLQKRAEEQRQQAEELRLQMARAALGG